MNLFDRILADIDAAHREEIAHEAAERGVSVETIEAERAEAERLAEIESRRLEEAYFQEQKARNDAETARRTEIGQQLGLGVRAHVGNIIHIGGLSWGSNGSGYARNTVHHVILNEDFERGRLKRSAWDLFCKPAKSLGRRSFGLSGVPVNGQLTEASLEPEQVSCKTCLEILVRMRKG